MTWLWAALAGCALIDGAAKPGDFDASFRVDCVGMVPLGGTERWGTPQVPQSEDHRDAGRRCEANIARDQIATWDEGVHAPGAFTVLAGGQRWTAQEGAELTIEQAVGDFYVRGSYAGPFTAEDGTEAWGEGWLDLCDPTVRLDCPYAIEGATPYPFETSSLILTAWGEGTDCRAVIDRDHGALQVDLQSGIWNGTNITQLYRSTCPDREDADPDWYRNRMTFKAAGVYGPGLYGPMKVLDHNGVQLPSLRWEAPPILMGSSTRVQVANAHWLCDDTAGPHVMETLNWSSYDNDSGVNSYCTFEVEDGDPGRVWIECSQVRHDRTVPTEIPCTDPNLGCGYNCDARAGTCGHLFEWYGACDVVYKGKSP